MFGFIVNRESGNGYGKKVWSQVESTVIKRDIEYVVRFTERPMHAKEIVAELLAKDVETVIVIGGDGTIHEVVNGLVYKNVSLGIIPAGSGNDFARCLGVPLAYEKALERIFENRPQQVDLLNLGERYSLTVAGIGFDGQVAKNVNEALYKKYLNFFRLGSLSYAISVLDTLRTYKPTNMQITVDGKKLDFADVWLAAAANTTTYGGGIKISPLSSHTDGKLDICVVHGLRRGKLIRLLPKAFKGKHISAKEVTLLKGEDIYISSDPPVLVQSDGEQVKQTPLHITVEKRALTLV
ncbi:diacylglycerol/lipid kinase family protein [Bacillus sp. FJAT-44742]|uniref:diacylglycerol/lipid kinase family protein n=1 Tax=Bacillus sp. FJAT-44742 TaxID=2014005 RepID=UPI000C24ADA6|nr:diacylglycerol kinase family protein [Bacillus sp. FJAT-44742]